MHAGRQTYYDVLGVDRKAGPREIERAYRKIRAEMQRETAPPDPRRATLVQTAYEVLADPFRRGEYDRSLLGPSVAGVAVAPRSRARWAAMLAAVAAAAGAYFALQERTGEPPPAAATAQQEIATAANLAVGRVHRLDISGGSAPLAVAFTLAEGEMVTACHGLVPGAQLVVRFGARAAPGRWVAADEEGVFCRLQMEGAGSWPLLPSRTAPNAGDKVYAVSLNPAGELVMKEARIKRVAAGPRGERVYEISTAVAPDAQGGPLLDGHGRVVAAAYAAKPGEAPRHRSLPPSWRAAALEEPAPQKPPRAEAEEGAPSRQPRTVPPPDSRNPANISPERADRLQKAFRPPPTVPDDL